MEDKIKSEETLKREEIDYAFEALHNILEEEPLLPVPQVMNSETLQEKLNACNFFCMSADPTKCVIKGSFTNAEIGKIGGRGKRPGEFNFPKGLRVNNREELYVCDSYNDRIQVFDLDLNFKREFGGPGTGKGQFSYPAGVEFESNDNIYITDIANHRIQVFTPKEHFVRFIRHKKLNDPVNMCIINDFLFVTDIKKCRIVVLKTSGEFVTTIGDGTLDQPEGIQVDQDGYVYVTSHQSKVIVY